MGVARDNVGERPMRVVKLQLEDRGPGEGENGDEEVGVRLSVRDSFGECSTRRVDLVFQLGASGLFHTEHAQTCAWFDKLARRSKEYLCAVQLAVRRLTGPGPRGSAARSIPLDA